MPPELYSEGGKARKQELRRKRGGGPSERHGGGFAWRRDGFVPRRLAQARAWTRTYANGSSSSTSLVLRPIHIVLVDQQAII